MGLWIGDDGVGLMLEDTPRMLQNEVEKSLGATLVAAVEIWLVLS